MPPDKSSSSENAPTYGKLSPVPNSPKTPHHSFRVPERLYRHALAVAHYLDEPLASKVREGLQEFVDAHPEVPFTWDEPDEEEAEPESN